MMPSVGASLRFLILFGVTAVTAAGSWRDFGSSEIAQSTFNRVKNEWVSQNSSFQPSRVTFQPSSAVFQPSPGEYEYEPLEARQIRLLVVTREQDPSYAFTFELVPVFLDRSVRPYLAISYTWDLGPSMRWHSIFSSSPKHSAQALNVSESVITILDTLLPNAGDSATLWVDAVCINQQNNTEKGHQVRLLREVYRRVGQVVISLGTATNDSDTAMDFIEPLKETMEKLRKERRRKKQGGQILRRDLLRELQQNKFPNPVWTTVRDLFNRPWFGRIWVIQEVVFGNRPVFVVGNRAVEWDSMASVACTLFDQGLLSLVEHDHKRPHIQHHYPEGIRSMAEMHHARGIREDGGHATFQEILMRFHHFGATKPADKVFALQGLATDTNDTKLDPDYTISVEEVYVRTARYLLQRDQSILILHRAGVGSPNRNTTLPSWVSDWRSFSEDNSFGSMHALEGYQASSEYMATVRLSSRSKDGLVLQGSVVDAVERVSPVRMPLTVAVDHSAPRQRTDCKLWLLEVELLVDILMKRGGFEVGQDGDPARAYYRTEERIQEALCRTLVANTTQLVPRPAEMRAHCASWGRYLDKLVKDGVPESMAENRWKPIAAFDDACNRATMGRRFFVTQNQHMGLSNPDTRPGD